MKPGLPRTLAAAAVYGFSIGTVRGAGQAAGNLLKFPVLILVTATVSAPAWYCLARAVLPGLGFREAQRLALQTFGDLAVLLASLAPVSLFLGLTVAPPVSDEDLGGYPMFLLLNVAFIAAAGGLALLRHGSRLARDHGTTARRGALLLAAWLLVTLAAGGQAAWYLRPYFGRVYEGDVAFIQGAAPGARGVRNFFEAVYALVGGS